MKRSLLALAVVLVFVMGAYAQELVTLTTPIVPPSTATYHVAQMVLDVDGSSITVILKGANQTDAPIAKIYNSATVPTGSSLLHTINTANFSTNSLIKAVYNRLIADGIIVGTVSGLPQ
jgi:hypothetical protein